MNMTDMQEKTMGTIRNVVFDAGGVLVAWEPEKIVAKVFDDPEVQERVKEAIFRHTDWTAYDKGTLSEADAITQFAERTNVAPEKIAELVIVARNSLTPIERTITMLERLESAGFSIYLLSNMPASTWEFLKEKYDFWNRFHGIVISSKIQMAKPDAEIYHHLLETHDLRPQETVFIDDNLQNVESAQREGIYAFQYTNADDFDARMKDFLGGF